MRISDWSSDVCSSDLPERLRGMLLVAAKQGTEKVFSEICSQQPLITKSEAFRRHGRTDVERWIQEGLVKPVILGGKARKKFIDSRKLEVVAKSSNRITYLPVAER